MTDDPESDYGHTATVVVQSPNGSAHTVGTMFPEFLLVCRGQGSAAQP